jgi:hypothetical protein
MRNVKCDKCEILDIPTNESIKVNQKVYCLKCFESEFPEKHHLEGKNVENQFDPTICSFCSKDNQHTEFNTISNYPICMECEIDVKNRAFPTWVKAFLTLLGFIIIFSFFWNWKFYSAYKDIEASNNYAGNGDYAKASSLMKSVCETVPEVEDVKFLHAYYNGIDLLSKDKSSEALQEFYRCKGKFPEDYKVDALFIQAKIGDSFDRKKYGEFLIASKENLAIDSTLSSSWQSIASAYACLYAENGQDSSKLLANKCLIKSKLIDSISKDSKEYCNMIEYRIDSRKIIRREDFLKKFPNGWTKNN